MAQWNGVLTPDKCSLGARLVAVDPFVDALLFPVYVFKKQGSFYEIPIRRT